LRLVHVIALLISPAVLAGVVASDPPLPPLGITVSGGVSLGTWEAGALYLYAEAQKLRPQGEVRVVTGASAGSANALSVAMSSCRAPNPYPRRDLGWRMWQPVGFSQLFDRKRATDDALFVRDALERSFDEVRGVWNEGLREGCDVVFAATVTRVKPRQVKLQEGLTVPRALETFVVRIQGRGPGRAPRLSNYGNPSSPVPVPLLPFVDDESDAGAAARNFDLLRSVIFASGAFPLAFAPQPIEYCLSKPPPPGQLPTPEVMRCERAELVDFFVDGGVFDNQPLRVAWSLAQHSMRVGPDGRAVWVEPFADGPGSMPSELQFAFFDPSASVYPAEVDDEETGTKHGVLSKLFSMGGGMVEAARARELVQLASENVDVGSRVHLYRGNLPKASEQLQNFIGFFEEDFRLFDFYVGMYDAFAELKDTPAWKGAPLDFDALMSVDDEARTGWAPFMCLLSVVEPGYERYASMCTLPGQDNFRVLLQVSIDRLYSVCRPKGGNARVAPGNRDSYHCARARLGHEGPQVPGVKVLEDRRRHRADREPSFDYFMRLLEAYGFEFRDLGLSKLHAGRGMLALRRRLDGVVEAWVAAQPSVADRVLTKTAATAGLNTLAYSPPPLSFYVEVGTVAEAGISVLPWSLLPQWLQVTAALGLNSFFSLFTDRRPQFTVNLVAGPELRLSFLSNPYVQPRLAVRAGAQFGVLDTFGTQRCELFTTDLRGCTQLLLEGVAAATLLERLRLQVVFQTYPSLYRRDSPWFNVQFAVGFQFY
jgi:predicted acylesterase/phospholipase RssA